MKWECTKHGFSLARVESSDVDSAMAELCQRIVHQVIPDNEGVDWDYPRVELWPDSGRIIVFPARSSTADRIENAGCQVVFNALLAYYEELADSDRDDADFSSELLAEEIVWAERFLKAARLEPGLAGRRFEFWDGDRLVLARENSSENSRTSPQQNSFSPVVFG